MDDYCVIIAAAAVIAVIIAVSGVITCKIRENKIKKEVAAALDMPPDPKRDNELESISEYYLFAKHKNPNADEITWNDLDMDDIFDRINTCESSVGEEYLYALLHRANSPENEELMRSLLERLDGDRTLRISICTALRNLGIFNYNSVAKVCIAGSAPFESIGKPWVYVLLPFMPIGAGILGFIAAGGIGAVLAAIAGCIVNMVIYYKTQIKIAHHMGMMKYICKILYCARKIGSLSGESFFAELTELYKPFNRAAAMLSQIGKEAATDPAAEIFEGYMKLITFRDLHIYSYVKTLIESNREAVRGIYERIGLLDSVCAVLNYRGSLDVWCEPRFTESRGISANGIVHPLIHGAVANNFDFSGDILVTGSNASGKSSFVKALAVNAIFARSILTCTAQSFSLKRCKVVTSMAVRDDICAGDSYFVAEIKSMKRIVDTVQNEYCLCVIDEILKGTNTVERIAASVSVLSAIGETESLCIAATHDIELTIILAEKYQNIHFEETVTEGGVTFDYTLKEGAAKTRNAIKLLKINGFPEEITASAEMLAEKLSVTKNEKEQTV